MMSFMLGQISLQEREELLRPGGARLGLGRGRGAGGERRLGRVPRGELAGEVGGERGGRGFGREGVGFDGAYVCVFCL